MSSSGYARVIIGAPNTAAGVISSVSAMRFVFFLLCAGHRDRRTVQGFAGYVRCRRRRRELHRRWGRFRYLSSHIEGEPRMLEQSEVAGLDCLDHGLRLVPEPDQLGHSLRLDQRRVGLLLLALP